MDVNENPLLSFKKVGTPPSPRHKSNKTRALKHYYDSIVYDVHWRFAYYLVVIDLCGPIYIFLAL